MDLESDSFEERKIEADNDDSYVVFRSATAKGVE